MASLQRGHDTDKRERLPHRGERPSLKETRWRGRLAWRGRDYVASFPFSLLVDLDGIVLARIRRSMWEVGKLGVWSTVAVLLLIL